jgi:hypothetical protein
MCYTEWYLIEIIINTSVNVRMRYTKIILFVQQDIQYVKSGSHRMLKIEFSNFAL